MLSTRSRCFFVVSIALAIAALYYCDSLQMFSTILDDDMSSQCAIVVGSGLAVLSAVSQLIKNNI